MQHAFFSLVRSGLWGTPADRQLFRSVSPDDWETVYRMANSQALLALTFDGISSLPAELRPPRALYLKWAARTAQIEQANKRLNQLLPELNTLYREAGLHPVLLKGQGIGTNYRTPLHRQCGDIDIYLGKQGQPIANRLLLQQGAIVEGEACRASSCQLQFERSTHREPPHHPPAEQSACQPSTFSRLSENGTRRKQGAMPCSPEPGKRTRRPSVSPYLRPASMHFISSCMPLYIS